MIIHIYTKAISGLKLMCIVISIIALTTAGISSNAKQRYIKATQAKLQDMPNVVPEQLKPTLDALKQKTKVPVILPNNLPAKISLFVYTATPSEYEISLDLDPDCRGTGACIFGDITGKRLAQAPLSERRMYLSNARGHVQYH